VPGFSPSAFVGCRNTRFELGGQVFFAYGVNCYFLSYCSEASARSALAVAKQGGANVIRSWAFPQERAGALDRLDAVIHAAEERDLRLILPLVNYWPDLEGMPVLLAKLDITSNDVHEFYRAPRARTFYRNWIERVLTRRNSITGRRYFEEPAILAWELANEPRCPIRGGRQMLLEWIAEMGTLVKELDANHLLGLGDEGFFHKRGRGPLYNGTYGVDFESTIALDTIDFGTYHLYPQSWGEASDLEFARGWIADHASAGARANKPVLLEEYGLKICAESVPSVADRNVWYARWLGWVQEFGGAGALLWMLGGEEPDSCGYRDDYVVLDAAEFPAPKPASLRQL
jgi:mannan endo-1,4-beta-mannosidase